MPTLPDAVVELERLLARLRSINAALLALDGYTRWGMRTADDEARASAEGNRLFPDLSDTRTRLTELVKSIRRNEPAVIAAWLDAHQTLLREFVAAHADEPDKSTECSVARGEIEAWELVRTGEKDLVEENVGYAHVDPARYTEVFGLPLCPGPSSEL